MARPIVYILTEHHNKTDTVRYQVSLQRLGVITIGSGLFAPTHP